MKRLLLAVLLAAAVSAQVPSAAVRGLHWRGIGPAATGGRIADLAVAEPAGQPEIMYVGTASGGVWKSSDAGVSWKPIFDHSGGMMSIGAVAVAPSNPNLVWVGTGEVDNRQSSSWGNGIFKSDDGGRTWHDMGLADSRHIAKIIIDPHDADIVYAAVLGHLWGSNAERGVYKTTDGGHTWKKVLYVDDNTGATDLAMSPADPHVLFAAMYQRQRRGWGFNGGGPGSGIYRSEDGGATWTKLTHGLPAGDKGRIGLAVNAADPSIVFAIIEADPPGRGGFGPPAPGRGRGAPPPPKGGVFRSLDQGQTWQHMSGIDPRPMYFSRIYLDPTDPHRVYIMGSERGFYISDDAGRTFRDVFSGVHGEDHVMWLDPRDRDHILIGGDGGVSISYDRGLTWSFRNDIPVGQFYNISTNSASPYLICGGLQDNGNWCIPSANHLSVGLSNSDTFNVGGGDGMQAVFDGDNHTVLVSLQNGNTSRVDLNTMERQNIGPVQPPTEPTGPGRGASPYRWNWTAPLVVSHFDAHVIYTGADVVFRSADQGRTWKVISPDLTAHIDRDKLKIMGAPVPANALSRNDGQDNFSALTVIAESPLDKNVLYTGADDGTLEITRDGGAHWTNLTHDVTGLPSMTYVSGIEPSHFAAGRVYATFDGHFNDDYHPYVYVSEDYGQSWRLITAGLPETSVHRIRENPANRDMLVAGLEEGVYASWDRGAHWTSLNTNLPPVPVYDLGFQKTTGDLVLGTHGRGIWILDDAGFLATLGDHLPAAGAGYLFPTPPARHVNIYTPQAWYGAGEYFAPNPPNGAVLTYALPAGTHGKAEISVTQAGKAIRTFQVGAHPGINRAVWNLDENPATPPPAGGRGRGGFFGRPATGPEVSPGRYDVTVHVPGIAPMSGVVTVSGEPVPAAHTAAVMSAYRLQQQLEPATKAAAAAQTQLRAMRDYLKTMGDPGTSTLRVVKQAAAKLGPITAAVARAQSRAAGVQRSVDSYQGRPTGDQLRELGWAWSDGTAAVRSLNQFLHTEMPPIYTALGGKLRWPPIAPVAVPVVGNR